MAYFLDNLFLACSCCLLLYEGLVMIACLRCGKCCYYKIDGKIKKCKHLVKLPNGKTLCRIYKKRLGTIIDKTKDGKVVRCVLRKDSKFDYEGCPFNTNKPRFEG